MAIIPIFVSSTFQDFQQERDLLNGPVQDHLDEILRPLGFRTQFVDLRWGISTAEQSAEDAMRKVMDVCLDEVVRTKPLFLGLLGCRQGFVPDPLQRDHVLQRLGIRLDAANDMVSVTELEFLAAGLNQEYDESLDPLVLVRELDGGPSEWFDADLQSLERFRDLVERSWGKRNMVTYRCRCVFPGSSEIDLLNILAGEERTSFEDLIVKELAPRLIARIDAMGNEGRDASQLFRDNLRLSVGLERLSTVGSIFLIDGSSCVITGGPGTGQTTLMLATEEAVRLLGHKVSSTVIGIDCHELRASSFSRHLVQQLWTLVALPGKPHISDETWQSDCSNALETVLAHEPNIVVTIDGVDQLTDEDSVYFLLGLLPSKKVPVLVAGTTPEQSRLAKSLGFFEMHLEPLAGTDCVAVVQAHVERMRKELPPMTLEVLASRPRTPLWIALALEQLGDLSAADFTSIRTQGAGGSPEKLLCQRAQALPDNDADMATSFLERAVNDCGDPRAQIACGLLARAKHGLSTDELALLLPLGDGGHGGRSLVAAQLVRRLGGQLRSKDGLGRWTFLHEQVRAAAMGWMPEGADRQLALLLDSSTPAADAEALRDMLWHALRVNAGAADVAPAVARCCSALGDASVPLIHEALREGAGLPTLRCLADNGIGPVTARALLDVAKDRTADSGPGQEDQVTDHLLEMVETCQTNREGLLVTERLRCEAKILRAARATRTEAFVILQNAHQMADALMRTQPSASNLLLVAWSLDALGTCAVAAGDIDRAGTAWRLAYSATHPGAWSWGLPMSVEALHALLHGKMARLHAADLLRALDEDAETDAIYKKERSQLHFLRRFASSDEFLVDVELFIVSRILRSMEGGSIDATEIRELLDEYVRATELRSRMHPSVVTHHAALVDALIDASTTYYHRGIYDEAHLTAKRAMEEATILAKLSPKDRRAITSLYIATSWLLHLARDQDPQIRIKAMGQLAQHTPEILDCVRSGASPLIAPSGVTLVSEVRTVLESYRRQCSQDPLQSKKTERIRQRLALVDAYLELT